MYNRFHNPDALLYEKGPKVQPQTQQIIQQPAKAPPPILRSNIAVKMEQKDMLKQQAKRKGQRAAVKAGETGGYAQSTILNKLGGGA
jgi:hypothetical protein